MPRPLRPAYAYASVRIEFEIPRAQSITAGASRCSASASVQRLDGATTCTDATGRRSPSSTGAAIVMSPMNSSSRFDAYTDGLWPGLAQSVIAANSFIVATEPLPDALARTILPGDEVASDSRRLLLYFRKDASGRLLMGSRGPFREPRGAADWAHLERSVKLMFPQLENVRHEYRWAGRIAITRDFLPHVHRPAPGLTIALGYNGRGIALATTLGRHLAAAMSGAARAAARRGTGQADSAACAAASVHQRGRRVVRAARRAVVTATIAPPA